MPTLRGLGFRVSGLACRGTLMRKHHGVSLYAPSKWLLLPDSFPDLIVNSLVPSRGLPKIRGTYSYGGPKKDPKP